MEVPEAVESGRREWAVLAVLGTAFFLALWILTSVMMQPAYRLAHDVRGASYGGPLTWPSRLLGLTAPSPGVRTAVQALLMGALFVIYIAAVMVAGSSNRRTVTLVLAAGFAGFCALLLFTPPLISGDVYSYAFYGRAMTVYKLNPYVAVPASRPGDVLFPLIGWRGNASVYGPLFNYLSYLVSLVAGDGVFSSVLGYKTAALFFYAACLPLAWGLARRVTPGKENMALAVAAWNPVLLVHTVGAAHNDIIMVFFILAGFMAYRKGRPYLGLVLVVLSVLVKPVGVLALGAYLVYYLRDPRRSVIKGLVSASLTVVVIPVLAYLPFLEGSGILETTRKMSSMYSSSSVPSLVRWVLFHVFSVTGMADGVSSRVAGGLTRGLFLVVLVVVGLFFLYRVKDFKSSVRAAACLGLLWCLTAGYVLPWYLTLPLMLVSVIGVEPVTLAALASSGVFCFYKLSGLHGVTTVRVAGEVVAFTNLHLSIPLAVILVLWLASELLSSRYNERIERAAGGKAGFVYR